MDLGNLVSNIAESGDPGVFLAKELEEGLEPITQRVDALEKKLDQLISLRFATWSNLRFHQQFSTHESPWRIGSA
jgi:hypothetical protein